MQTHTRSIDLHTGGDLSYFAQLLRNCKLRFAYQSETRRRLQQQQNAPRRIKSVLGIPGACSAGHAVHRNHGIHEVFRILQIPFSLAGSGRSVCVFLWRSNTVYCTWWVSWARRRIDAERMVCTPDIYKSRDDWLSTSKHIEKCATTEANAVSGASRLLLGLIVSGFLIHQAAASKDLSKHINSGSSKF